jgi:hypothetical protein
MSDLEERLLAAEAKRRGISITQLRMSMAVDTKLVRDIVADNRGASRSASLIPGSKSGGESVRIGTGWISPKPLEPPPGVKQLDRIMDAQDAADRRELAKRLKGERP